MILVITVVGSVIMANAIGTIVQYPFILRIRRCEMKVLEQFEDLSSEVKLHFFSILNSLSKLRCFVLKTLLQLLSVLQSNKGMFTASDAAVRPGVYGAMDTRPSADPPRAQINKVTQINIDFGLV